MKSFTDALPFFGSFRVKPVSLGSEALEVTSAEVFAAHTELLTE